MKRYRSGLRPQFQDGEIKEISNLYERLRRGQADLNKAGPRLFQLLTTIDEELAILRLQVDELKQELENERKAAPLRAARAEPKADGKRRSRPTKKAVGKRADDSRKVPHN